MTIRAKAPDRSGNLVFTLDTAEDIQNFFAWMGLEGWGTCQYCGRGFKAHRSGQKYCPIAIRSCSTRVQSRSASLQSGVTTIRLDESEVPDSEDAMVEGECESLAVMQRLGLEGARS